MAKKLIYSFCVFCVMLFSGCLVFHKVSYEVTADKGASGTANVTIYDIRSNADNDDDFEADKKNLFDFMLVSDEFLDTQKQEGKNIVSRELWVDDEALNGKVVFNFDDITNVEGLRFEDGFYYITLPLSDSVVSTNGEIIKSKDYKRILWDSKIDTLKFEMLSFTFEQDIYRDLAPFYKK